MSTKSLTFINHYKILGLWPSTTLDEIKKQYRNKYKLTHPDKNPNSSDAADQFQVVNKAYNILSDKNSKNDYDKELFNWALKNRDNNIIIAFLNQNIKFNINENDNIGNTPLHIAIRDSSRLLTFYKIYVLCCKIIEKDLMLKWNTPTKLKKKSWNDILKTSKKAKKYLQI